MISSELLLTIAADSCWEMSVPVVPVLLVVRVCTSKLVVRLDTTYVSSTDVFCGWMLPLATMGGACFLQMNAGVPYSVHFQFLV